MNGDVAFWLSLVILVVLFVNGENDVDLHTAIISWLMEK